MVAPWVTVFNRAAALSFFARQYLWLSFAATSFDKSSEVVDADDIETLQEMTVQAINDALTKVDEATQKKLGAFAGKLPF